MKLKKAKALLDKVNNLFSGFSDNLGKVSAMERDLLLNYLRDLYEMVLVEEKEDVKDTAKLQYEALLKEKEMALQKLELARIEAENKAREERLLRENAERKAHEEFDRKKMLEEAARNAAKQKAEEESRIKAAAEKELLEQAKRKAAEDAYNKAELEARLKLEEQLKKEAAAKEALISKSTSNPVAMHEGAQGPNFNEEMEELFEIEETRELSQKISLRPVKNIKKAISINDRLLYINELFNKDASEMEQTVNTLNSLENFDQARLYIEQKVANQYNWLAKKRKKRAREFIDVVRRKFL